MPAQVQQKLTDRNVRYGFPAPATADPSDREAFLTERLEYSRRSFAFELLSADSRFSGGIAEARANDRLECIASNSIGTRTMCASLTNGTHSFIRSAQVPIMSELCLVTGGAGFIGSHLVEALLAQGKQVRVLDDLSTGTTGNFIGFANPPEFIHGTVTNLETLMNAATGASVVYHLAAMASVAKSLEDPLACHAVCASGTLNLLEAARRLGVHRIVYAGSSSAYGKASDPAGQSETTPLNPLSPYAAAKLAGEHYLEAFAESFGIETVRLRFFNIFGPRQRADSPYSGVIAIFIGMLMQGKVPVVHGDGLQARDFVYVENCVQAILKAGSVPGISGRVYNVGTGTSVTLLQLIETLNKVLGTSVVPQHGAARTGDVRFSSAKIDRIRAELSYEPTIDFEEGLRRTVAWYRTL